MRTIIFILIPFFNLAQVNDTIYCNQPDKDAYPIGGNKSIVKIVSENFTKQTSQLESIGKFYINATILKDGTVFEFNVEEILDDGCTFVTKINTENLQKWMPAITNGKPCNQKLRLKTYIHFE